MQIVEEINLETNNQYTYSKKAEKRNARRERKEERGERRKEERGKRNQHFYVLVNLV